MATTAVSKTMALLLRHQPELGHLTLDGEGWVALEDLVVAVAALAGRPVSDADVASIVAADSKGRYSIVEDEQGRLRIRANQGHSTGAVALTHVRSAPPNTLFHGTAATTLPAILAEGLKPMARHHVHLSCDAAAARSVGARHGKPVTLRVDAEAMHAAGTPFYVSDNGVWLVAAVPPEHLTLL